ncbi:MAG: uroporphyrinogen-III C-methyltransferase [Cyclobacteriaceae bacterium]|nr:uroporphyrinogen-III C-methyltransferase [Cyclobacteriaceae bacterium]
MHKSKPTLFLVGAGPGDPDLISVKGLKILQQADVVLYDALVSPLLLANVQENCKRIYVGKRKGIKEFTQDEINHLLVYYARRFSHVVRLKGGDCNVFGRGHEELKFATLHGVTVEVIPGISSSLSAPTAAGIPLTLRGVSEGFWVVTGTTSRGQLSEDFSFAAQSTATIIVLMGLSQIADIANIIQQARSPQEPMAVIQNATLPQQKVVVGTASSIHQQVIKNEITTPAVIVIGKVIEQREQTSGNLKVENVNTILRHANCSH